MDATSSGISRRPLPNPPNPGRRLRLNNSNDAQLFRAEQWKSPSTCQRRSYHCCCHRLFQLAAAAPALSGIAHTTRSLSISPAVCSDKSFANSICRIASSAFGPEKSYPVFHRKRHFPAQNPALPPQSSNKEFHVPNLGWKAHLRINLDDVRYVLKVLFRASSSSGRAFFAGELSGRRTAY